MNTLAPVAPKLTGREVAKAREAAECILDLHHPERSAPVPLGLILMAAGYRTGRKRDPIAITSFLIRDALGQRTIGLNTRQSPRSQNVALAHAMGHGELHDEELLICHEVRTPRLDQRETGQRSRPTAAMERQAGIFALELLMPTTTVYETVDGYFDDSEHALREVLAKRVAELFQVPETAAAHRLIELAILAP